MTLAEFVADVLAGKVLGGVKAPGAGIIDAVAALAADDPEAIAAEAYNQEVVVPEAQWEQTLSDVKAALQGSKVAKFSPDQPRDEAGKFGEMGGTASAMDLSADLGISVSIPQIGTTEERIQAVEEQIRGHKGYEVGVAIDSTGAVVFAARGPDATRLEKFTPEQRDALRDATFTHNHASAESFDGADLAAAVANDMAEIRVVGVTSSGEQGKA